MEKMEKEKEKTEERLEEWFKKAIRSDPNSPEAHNLLEILLSKQGIFDKINKIRSIHRAFWE